MLLLIAMQGPSVVRLQQELMLPEESPGKRLWNRFRKKICLRKLYKVRHDAKHNNALIRVHNNAFIRAVLPSCYCHIEQIRTSFKPTEPTLDLLKISVISEKVILFT